MFWLANLVTAHPGRPSPHEQWWRTANVERVIEFDAYVPFLKNSMLRPKPWRENFNTVFGKSSLSSVLEDPNSIHFYLTRSNVAQGRLEFSTNWTKVERERALQSEDIQVDSFTEPRNVDQIREAVFASMDLPPLFPYQEIGGEYFEDGGVVDNLPIRFGTLVEECDLLFVLALNSSFEETPDKHSIFVRLMRVLDVRQGVLERNSLRMAYLYNHINHLSGSSGTAAAKARKVVRVFAICPDQPLTVNTSEFWKTENFGQAFRMMYDATRVELSRFNFMADPAIKSTDRHDWLRMALVSPAGEITYNYRF
jgi:predicted acylesterase/phospholipase RssA